MAPTIKLRYLFTRLIGIIISNGQLTAQPYHIHFEEGPWNETLAKAAKEKKLIFVDAYTTWCGPCKWMAANVFTDSAIAAYFNKNFINAKIDMEKGAGIQFAEKYGVKAYPTFLYIDATGKVAHRTCGSAEAKVFIEYAKTALDADKNLAHYVQVFESGKYDAAFIKDYLELLGNACSADVNKVATAYLAGKSEAELPTKENWQVIQKYVTDIHSREFNYLLHNRAAFEKFDDPKAIDFKIFSTYTQAATELIRSSKTDQAAYETFRKEIYNSGYERSHEVIINADLNWYKKTGDWDKYAITAVTFLDKYPTYGNDPQALNKFAWSFFENITSQIMLEQALVWAQKSVSLQNASYNNDTYANLLFKLGRKEEAIAAEEKALALAKKETGGDVAGCEETIAKFKK